MPRGPSFLALLLAITTLYSTWRVDASSPLHLSLFDFKDNDAPLQSLAVLSDEDKKAIAEMDVTEPSEPSEPTYRSALPTELKVKPARSSSRPGMINHGISICYLNSVVTSLFAATPFRRLIYTATPTNTLTAVLAETFARLQTVTGSIGTSSTLMKAFKAQYSEWDFKIFQCSLEFAYNLLDIMPDLAHFSFSLTRYSVLNTPRSDEIYQAFVEGRATLDNLMTRVVTSQSESNPLILTAPCYPSIQDAFNSGFRDEAYESRTDEYDFNRIEGLPEVKAGQREVETTRFDFVSIANAPEVFSFGIKRVSWTLAQDINFVDREMVVNPEVTIKTEAGETHRYLLQSFTHYAGHHYISYQCDYTENDGRGQWYRFNDEEVSYVSSEEELDRMWRIAAIAATFVVYVREDQVARTKEDIPAVPDSYLKLARFTHDLQSINHSNLIAAHAKTQTQARASPIPLTQGRQTAAPHFTMEDMTSFLPSIGSPFYMSEYKPNMLRTEFDRKNAIPSLNLERFQPAYDMDADLAALDADLSMDTELLSSLMDMDPPGSAPRA